MLVLNEHGLEVEVDHETIEHLKKRDVWKLYRTSPRQTMGEGPEKNICLLLQRNGIGDAIHALPAISQKILEGFAITVVAEPFLQEWFERVGAHFIPAEPMMVGFVEENKKKYSKFFSLSQWCIDHDEVSCGTPTVTRFQQFADLIETSLPSSFEWYSILQPQQRESADVILGLQSTSNHRSYLKSEALKRALKTAKYSLLEIGTGKGRTRTTSIQELVELVFSARVVVAVDSGVLAIAAALQKQTIALFGPTSEEIIVDQFDKYQLPVVTTIRSSKDDVCKRPCNFQVQKGYGIDGKCKASGRADCMQEITVEELMQEVEKKLRKITA